MLCSGREMQSEPTTLYKLQFDHPEDEELAAEEPAFLFCSFALWPRWAMSAYATVVSLLRIVEYACDVLITSRHLETRK